MIECSVEVCPPLLAPVVVHPQFSVGHKIEGWRQKRAKQKREKSIGREGGDTEREEVKRVNLERVRKTEYGGW